MSIIGGRLLLDEALEGAKEVERECILIIIMVSMRL